MRKEKARKVIKMADTMSKTCPFFFNPTASQVT